MSTTAAAPTDLSRCARCATATVTVNGATPWCPACEWNLDLFEPARRTPELGWRWADRRIHRIAYRLTGRQFAELVGRSLDRPRISAARIVTVTASVLLLVGIVALAVLGVWLVTYSFPAPAIVPGVAALGLAVALRPRFGRPDPHADILTPEQAPALHRLIEQVAAAVGAPAPHIVQVEDTFNAYATSVGLRHRRVLCLGLPLWGVLRPQERVALLGHELGHFVNGDVRRSLLTQPAFTTLASAADLVRPHHGSTDGVSPFVMMAVRVVQAMAVRVLLAAHVLLVWVGLRDTQRAEYLADELAATAAGSTAAVDLHEVILLTDSIELVVRREARAGRGVAHWRAAADEARTALRPGIGVRGQLSIRDEVSLFASHPPVGMRLRMLRGRTWRTSAVGLTETESAGIDAELVKEYERVRRVLAWSH
ncbi:M48 family metalloprotease [Micromonospora sp. NBC_01796]|uniref:M48 family metalloprotease n=1 Tax=Micromonospora sp. NBC_01796 TaxID=2975987 RepID=UPI002DD94E5C|nr:M48 family metalloprotease [Micromonospora sp. NBC_01796]WSA90022.1 M48 family metalloprotease [Micromonospora sp. NBC_01796]